MAIARQIAVGSMVQVMATGEVGQVDEITAAFNGELEFIVELADSFVGFKADELEIVR